MNQWMLAATMADRPLLGVGRPFRVIDRKRIVRWLALYTDAAALRGPARDAVLRIAGACLDRLIDEGLPFTERDGERYFDLCEVRNFSCRDASARASSDWQTLGE